jgi:hypothetical protein
VDGLKKENNKAREIPESYSIESDTNSRTTLWSQLKMKINQGIKVRIYPNQQQRALLIKLLGVVGYSITKCWRNGTRSMKS